MDDLDHFKMCKMCKKYVFLEKHECPPKWKIIHEERLGENFKVVYAWNYEDAAREYGEWYDRDDHALVESEDITIQVEPFEGGERKIFRVGAEVSIDYYVRKLNKI